MSTTQQIKLQSYTKAKTLAEPYKTESHGPVVHKQENLINIVLEKLFYNNKKKKKYTFLGDQAIIQMKFQTVAPATTTGKNYQQSPCTSLFPKIYAVT